MGVLWVAEHRALGVPVVIKFLCDELSGDPSAAKHIAREAAAAARVRSPHVVQILDHGISDDAPYLVMELLEGRDLRRVLEARGALSTDETSAIVHQLAKALARTHAEGLVHRDIKPSNIFLLDGAGDPFVKLLDFGLALRTPSTDASSGEARPGAGTPLYMSPEQITGSVVDARSDIWSLGIVAFECLTGRRPFQGETFGAIALAMHTQELPRPSELKPELPRDLDGWFQRACSRAPRERFATAPEASEALASALGVRHRTARAPLDAHSAAGSDRTLTGDGWQLGGRPGRPRGRRLVRVWGLAGVLSAGLLAAAAAGRWSSPANATLVARVAAPVQASTATGSADPVAAPETLPPPPEATASSPPESPPTRRPQQRTTTVQAHASPREAIPGAATARAPVYELPDERH